MDIRELHRQAMGIADSADLKKRHGNREESLSLYEQSYNYERAAAMKAYNDNIGEPSISVLLRSAASIAMSCQKYREAEKLIGLALSGEPPYEIAEELRDLLEDVNFHRHLKVKGVELSEDEVQLVIAGNGVGHGFAKTKEVMNRIKTFRDLTIRTTERISGKEFRKKGAIATEHKSLDDSYISPFRAASMAFSIRFGLLDQSVLSGFGKCEKVIEDMRKNIDLINENRIDILRENIQDHDYFSNFIALTKELAPDGDNITLFGMTFMKYGRAEKALLTRNKKELSGILRQNILSEVHSNVVVEEEGSVKGTLRAANATTHDIVIDSGIDKVKLKVPNGLSDIVRNHWDEEVTVCYRNKKGGKEKEFIDIID
jgi:hypothetical protein